MGLSPWKCWRLWQRQMSPLSEAGPSESPWSHASCRSWLPFLLHEQSLEPQEEGSGGPGWKHHDDCEHKRSRQWQMLNWIRLIKPHYLRIFATTLQFSATSFCIFATRSIYTAWGSTDLLWSKKRYVTNTRPNWPPLVFKMNDWTSVLHSSLDDLVLL